MKMILCLMLASILPLNIAWARDTSFYERESVRPAIVFQMPVQDTPDENPVRDPDESPDYQPDSDDPGLDHGPDYAPESERKTAVTFVDQSEEAEVLSEVVANSEQQARVKSGGRRDGKGQVKLVIFVDEYNRASYERMMAHSPVLAGKVELVTISKDEQATMTGAVEPKLNYPVDSSSPLISPQLRSTLKAKSVGVLICAATSGVYVAPIYLSAGLETAVTVWTTSFVIGSLRTVFSKQWRSFVNSGVTLGDWVVSKYKKVFKKEAPVSREMAQNFGKLGVNLSWNIAMSALFLSLNHSALTALMVLRWSSLGLYDDVWDIYVGQLVQRGLITQAKFEKYLNYRMIASTVIETLAFNVTGSFQVVMGMIGVAGLGPLLRGEKMDSVMKYVVPGMKPKTTESQTVPAQSTQPKKTLAEKTKSYFSALACNLKLSKPKFTATAVAQ